MINTNLLEIQNHALNWLIINTNLHEMKYNTFAWNTKKKNIAKYVKTTQFLWEMGKYERISTDTFLDQLL